MSPETVFLLPKRPETAQTKIAPLGVPNMADSSFDPLVLTLGESEREDLLERIFRHSDLSSEPLYTKTVDKPKKAGDEFSKLPFFLRIWYALIGFFFGKPAVKVYETNLIAKVGREINLSSPGYYNYAQGLLLPDMYQSLVDLKNAARFFYNALDSSVNRERGAFYAFMASYEMPEMYRQLSGMSNFAEFSKLYADKEPGMLRQMALDMYAESLTTMTDSQRESMYQNVRSLICLKELAGFLYDRLIINFQNEAALHGKVCPAAMVKGQLSGLNNMLFSLKEVPSLTLLGTLFIFSLRDEFMGKTEKINSETQKLLAQTEKSLAVIRDFNKKVPLTLILRCANRDMAYEPSELSGGEDWFLVFRNYWKSKIEESYDKYVTDLKREEINKVFDIFFSGMEMIDIQNTQIAKENDTVSLDNALLFSFFLTFYKKIFLAEMNQVLRPILIDGEFIKKENRLDFTESYNELIKMEDAINNLVRKAAPNGDYGNRYRQLRTDVVSPVIRHRKMQVLTEEIRSESYELAWKAKSALEMMNSIIHGILFPTEGSKYASLANLSTILGKANSDFMIELKETSKKLALAVDLVGNIMDVEGPESD
jgi:hypothetical protein